jgi:hypothetical protein
MLLSARLRFVSLTRTAQRGSRLSARLNTDLMLEWRKASTMSRFSSPGPPENCNLEEPDEFDRIVAAFFGKVERGRWPERDLPAAGGTGIAIGRAG